MIVFETYFNEYNLLFASTIFFVCKILKLNPVYIFFQQIKNYQIGPKDEKERKPTHEFLSKLIWLISTARNIIVVVFCGALAYIFEVHESQPFILTGSLEINAIII